MLISNCCSFIPERILMFASLQTKDYVGVMHVGLWQPKALVGSNV